MAGVPTGRGCDACRKQKKKCDLGRPACSRCTRLRIPCVGCGEKRYQFKDGRPSSADTTTPQDLSPARSRASSPAPAQVPGNELTRETSALVALLGITDLRYDVSGFGAFLKDIPRRMGRNKALDASVHAFTALYPILYSQDMHVSSAMLAAYVRALESLRIILEDRVTAQTPETLAAIYLVTISQGWIGRPDDKPVSHSEAVVHILNCITTNGWTGQFENKLFITLSVSIVRDYAPDFGATLTGEPQLPEAIYNPNISPGPWFRRIVDTMAPYGTTSQRNGGPGPAVGMLTLARVIEFVREPQGDITDIQYGYHALLQETAQARDNLERMQGGCGPYACLAGGVDGERIQLLCKAQFGVLLATTMLVNSLLYALMPANIELVDHVAGFPDELADLSRSVSRYKPVGSGFISTCLLMACVATTDPAQLAKMTAAMEEYGLDPIQSKWEYWASEMRTRFQDLRFKVALAHLENGVAQM